VVKKTNKKAIYKIVASYLKVLKANNVRFKRVYLYGSSVQGNFNQDSDIDLAIVSDDFTGDVIDDGLLLMRLRRKIDSRIEPHPFLTEEFSSENPFVKHILESGEEIQLEEKRRTLPKQRLE